MIQDEKHVEWSGAGFAKRRGRGDRGAAMRGRIIFDTVVGYGSMAAGRVRAGTLAGSARSLPVDEGEDEEWTAASSKNVKRKGFSRKFANFFEKVSIREESSAG